MKTSEALKICHEVVSKEPVQISKHYFLTERSGYETEFEIFSRQHSIYHNTIEEAVQKFVAYHKKSETVELPKEKK